MEKELECERFTSSPRILSLEPLKLGVLFANPSSFSSESPSLWSESVRTELEREDILIRDDEKARGSAFEADDETFNSFPGGRK